MRRYAQANGRLVNASARLHKAGSLAARSEHLAPSAGVTSNAVRREKACWAMPSGIEEMAQSALNAPGLAWEDHGRAALPTPCAILPGNRVSRVPEPHTFFDRSIP